MHLEPRFDKKKIVFIVLIIFHMLFDYVWLYFR